MQTAQEFINIKDIKDRYLYTRDGMAQVFLQKIRDDDYEDEYVR